MKRFMFLIAFLLVVSSFPLAVFGQEQSAPPQPATRTHQRTTHMTTDPALLHPATLTAQAPDVYEVKFETTKGDFVVKVTRAWAPIGADRFYNLVEHNYFNDASFFRIVPGFVVQFGLSADPAVNKVWMNAKIKDDPVKQSNRPGYLTFATAGPNTRTTQIFINLGKNDSLDSQGFAPFGQVTSGMEVVRQFFTGYGETPDQSSITYQGKAYIDKNFPKLDSIKSATVISPSGNAPRQ